MKITYDTYPEYQKCIQKLTWKWVKRSRFGFDELLSEADIGFMKAVDSFDDDKACFHTHLYITVNGRLRNYINQNNCLNSLTECIDLTIESNQANPEQNCTFLNLIENLSTEAKEMVEVVLNTPSEMIELVRAMSSNRGIGGGRPSKKVNAGNTGPNTEGKVHLYKSNVRAYFSSKGWGPSLILSCFNEIKQTFN